EIKNLIEFQEEMKPKLKENKDMTFYFEYNRRFHYHILSMVHSERISNHTMNLWDLNDFYLSNLSEKINLDTEVAIHYHDQIVSALEKRDPLKAKKLMQQHFKDYIERIETRL